MTLLGLTQVEAGRALRQVRPETVSRWETRPARVRPLHAQTARYLIEIARMLREVAPTDEERHDWSLTPDLARAARRAGFDALIVPSAAGRHHNLVVFKDLMRSRQEGADGRDRAGTASRVVTGTAPVAAGLAVVWW